MADAVLISIRPEWVNKIISGAKTVEVRKTKPNLKPPFKCYIYCTKGRLALLREIDDPEEPYKFDVWEYADFHEGCGLTILGCKVIGEFTCDRVHRLTHVGYMGTREAPALRAYKPGSVTEHCPDFDFSASCLTVAQINDYLAGGDGYAWHIADLRLFDVPEDLRKFHRRRRCNSCEESGYESMACAYDDNCVVPAVITKAPQSWCYVEKLENG